MSLHRALHREEFLILYQPQVDMATGVIAGAEALIRWEHPTLGLLAPDCFLKIAEDSGLVVDIDRWVRRTAFAQAAAWLEAGTPLRVAVNLSTRDLHNPDLAEEIRAVMDGLDLDPALVDLEVTDRVVMPDDQLSGWLPAATLRLPRAVRTNASIVVGDHSVQAGGDCLSLVAGQM